MGATEDSPKELRKREARSLRGLDTAALRATLTETTWTASVKGPYVLLMAGLIFAVVALGCGYGFASAERLDGGAWAWLVVLPLAASAVFAIAEFVFQRRNPPWVRLDRTGVTRSRSNVLRPSHPPSTYPWAQCGPFTAKSRWRGADEYQWVAECTFDGGKLRIPTDVFGGVEDLVTILNAYRSAFSPADPAAADR